MKEVEWGEFSFRSIFNRIKQGRRLRKEDQIAGDIPFVMAGRTNTGVANYISNPVSMFPENSITMDIFGNAFYRSYSFGAGDDTGVYWDEKKEYSPKVMLFFVVAMQKAVEGNFSYGKKLRSSKSLDFKMRLPVKDGIIDYAFMERFIAELEAERVKELEAEHVRELEAYMEATGLKDYILTPAERNVLAGGGKRPFKKFNLRDLFGSSTRGKRLKSADRVCGILPFVTAGEANAGISDFVGNDVMIFSSNTVTIDMFGSAKYRNYEYGADDHVAVVHTENVPKLASIYVTAAIHKASHDGQFSYARNFYAKDADALNIMLPEKDGRPDWRFMERVISAVQKIVVQDLVLYSERKMLAVKEVVNR